MIKQWIMGCMIIGLMGAASNGYACKQKMPKEGVELKVGESIVLEKLTLAFTGVENDSRCPKNTQCIWAGKAEVAVDLHHANGQQKGVKLLLIPTKPEAMQVQFEGYQIRLVSLMPHPVGGQTIKPQDYKATFEVISIE